MEVDKQVVSSSERTVMDGRLNIQNRPTLEKILITDERFDLEAHAVCATTAVNHVEGAEGMGAPPAVPHIVEVEKVIAASGNGVDDSLQVMEPQSVVAVAGIGFRENEPRAVAAGEVAKNSAISCRVMPALAAPTQTFSPSGSAPRLK
ncbi:MAG: hypothetical protein AB7U95_30960 [Reyranella sp.]